MLAWNHTKCCIVYACSYSMNPYGIDYDKLDTCWSPGICLGVVKHLGDGYLFGTKEGTHVPPFNTRHLRRLPCKSPFFHRGL